MKSIAVIGCGAVAEYAARHWLASDDLAVGFAIIEHGMESRARQVFGEDIELRYAADDIPAWVGLAVDCAGHAGLREHGEAILEAGIDLLTVSSGALADDALRTRLVEAARRGDACLTVVSGAIGALDALAAAAVGGLSSVTYRGRKPPAGWRGSPAEDKLDLEALNEATVHYRGSARGAALEYPKNANVAASVALAGLGFDETEVELIADPGIAQNIHEIVAEGDFGRFEFRIAGDALPDNPRSSAITAMSVVRASLNRVSAFVI